MKKRILGYCSVAGIVSAVLSPTLAHAYDGQINFSGSISDVTCNINGRAPGEGNQLDVNLGNSIDPSTFKTIGSTSAAVPFQLQVGGNAACTDDTKVVIDFDQGSTNINPATGNLKLIGTKPAKGVEIQIRDNGNGKNGKIALGQPQSLADAQVATVTDNVATLSYTASYVSTVASTAITPGSGNSFIRYTLAYY
ncbi:fimbrial protein [Burkholderia stagnalis]|uniref:fimbrial protein n=1 Tax=Burkholderia stagnalis TaxID=1503054 RepID=UPI0007600BC1|nr:fimbrial protein [Burkholderia stagnalis]KWK49080.1 fimbrial protein [Burkholderia stagnalis]KWK66319.1 fimbrial protein [Burkholderia stagnalis]KWN74186.1 fimbrial protein [Burkholderia stagnalis]